MTTLNRMQRLLILVVIAGTLTLYVLIHVNNFRTREISPLNNDTHSAHQTKLCPIPQLDPNHPRTLKWTESRKVVTRREHRVLAYLNSGDLFVNDTVVKIFAHDGILYSHCSYQGILGINDYLFKYTPMVNFTNYTQMPYEFSRVSCFRRNGSVFYVDFHINIQPKQQETMSKRDEKVPNIMMIGLDSVSRSQMVRALPLTHSFLKKELKAVEIIGENRVGKNTFPNIVPLLTGKHTCALPLNIKRKKQTFDDLDFIWKKYAALGHKTLFAEDRSDITIFNYVNKGFRNAPTDHYYRHLGKAIEQEKSLWNHHYCVNNKLEMEVMFEYVYQFHHAYRDVPTFSFTMTTRLTHDYLADSASADRPHLKFFRNMADSGMLNRTIVIFFSDHGLGFGEFAQTDTGKLETDLPFLFIVVPQWFRNDYHRLYSNMVENSERLTTLFDVHATLEHILCITRTNMSLASKGSECIGSEHQKLQNTGISLFEAIPRDRTCARAGIPIAFCSCKARQHLSNQSSLAIGAGKKLILHINNELENYTKCLKHSISEIMKFQKISEDSYEHNAYWPRESCTISLGHIFSITLKTSARNATFQANLSSTDGSEFSVDAITRLDRYGSGGSCIDMKALRRFCICR